MWKWCVLFAQSAEGRHSIAVSKSFQRELLFIILNITQRRLQSISKSCTALFIDFSHLFEALTDTWKILCTMNQFRKPSNKISKIFYFNNFLQEHLKCKIPQSLVVSTGENTMSCIFVLHWVKWETEEVVRPSLFTWSFWAVLQI